MESLDSSSTSSSGKLKAQALRKAASTRRRRRWRRVANRLRRLHNEAYLYLKQGSNAEGTDMKAEAYYLYTASQNCIMKALTIQEDYEKKKKILPKELMIIIAKMAKNLTFIQERLKKIKAEQPKIASTVTGLEPKFLATADIPKQKDLPVPPGKGIPSTSNAKSTKKSSAASSNKNTKSPPSVSNKTTPSDSVEAELIYSISSGVQIFFVGRDRNVGAPSFPCELAIYRFRDSSRKNSRSGKLSEAFIKIGGWVYPLHSNWSPILETSWGAYVFPDVTTEHQGKPAKKRLKFRNGIRSSLMSSSLTDYHWQYN